MNKINPRSNMNTKNTKIYATVKIEDKINTPQSDEKSKKFLPINKNTNPKRYPTASLINPSAAKSLVVNEKKKENSISTKNLIEIKRIDLETSTENLITPEFPKLEEIKKNTIETFQENLSKNITEEIPEKNTEFKTEQTAENSTKISNEKCSSDFLDVENEIQKKVNEEINFCITVDGSHHSEHAFEIVTEDLMKQEDKLLIVHIFNSKMDERNNYANKKENIVENYSSKLSKLQNSNVSFIIEDRTSKIHPLEQVNRIYTNFKANYLICGYHGIRGPRGDNKELSKGIDYLLNFSTIPTIFIKEKTQRNDKPDKQFKWLFVFDREYTFCYSILNKFLPLIDNEKDIVSGLTLTPSWLNKDTIKKDFMNDMEKLKIKNFEYDQQVYHKNPSILVNSKVNLGDVRYDFVVFYYCPKKYKDEGTNSEVLNIVTKCCSNICFVNGQ